MALMDMFEKPTVGKVEVWTGFERTLIRLLSISVGLQVTTFILWCIRC